jgi:hypothetical protein
MPVVRGVRWTVGAPLLIATAVAWFGAMALLPVSAEAQQLPVAAYSFDAGEGEVLEDLTGNGHDGAVEGADWTSRGRYGGALEFDESGDCVSIPDSPDLQLSEEFTLEAWVRPQAESEDHPVIFKEIEKSMSYGLFLVAGAYPQGSVSPQPSKFVDDKAIDPLPQKVWSHLAFTFDGAKLRIYVNGELIHAVASAGPIASEKALRIGCSRYWKEVFDGRIDEVRVYNRVLDAGEVGDDRTTPLQTSQQLPIAAYSFDAGEGEVLEDLTGNGHDGAVEGGEWVDRGRYGGALEFSGESGECVTVPDSEELRGREEFTLEAWVRPNSPVGDDPILFRADGGNYGEVLGIGIWSPARAEGIIGEGKSEWESVTGTEAIEANVWTHLAFTYDGAKMRLYSNGTLVGTQAQAAGPTGGAGPLVIGCNPNWTSEVFDGRIDEVRVYNRVLDAGEVGDDRTTPLQTSQQLPIAAYSFDAGEGEVLEDLTGNGHDGAVEGGEWVDRGRYGGALEFSGESGECVTVPDSEELRGREEFTLEAWVRPNSPVGDDPILFRADGGNYGEVLGIGIWSPARAEGIIGEGKSEWESVTGTEAIEANVWTHLAFTYDGAKMRLYSNGTLVGTQAQAAGPTGGAGPLVIGCNPNWTSEVFDGRIDEVRVYNRALSAGEVAGDMGEAIPLPPTSATATAEAVGANEAILMGAVDPKGSQTTYRFEYGTTTAYGQVVPEAEEEVVEGNEEVAEEAVAFLSPNTTYHYRVVASNRAGTTYGQDMTFTTAPSSTTPKQEEEEAQEEVLFTGKFTGSLPANFVNLNWSGFGDTGRMATIKQSHTGLLRIGINNLADFPSMRSDYDDIFLAAADNEIRILFVLGSKHIPAGSNTSTISARAKEIVNRYGPEGSLWKESRAKELEVGNAYAPTYWQVWNEPNIGKNSLQRPGVKKSEQENNSGPVHPAEFGDFLAQVSAAIKNAEPSAKVLVGGLLAVNREKGGESKFTPQAFISKMGHRSAYDAVGLHPYVFKASRKGGKEGPPRNPTEVKRVKDRVRAGIKRFQHALEVVEGGSSEPRKRIWIDELGWPVKNLTEEAPQTHPPVSVQVQAELLRSTFTMIKAKSKDWAIDKVFYWNSRDSSGGEWDQSCGLVTAQNDFRLAWSAFQAQAAGN